MVFEEERKKISNNRAFFNLKRKIQRVLEKLLLEKNIFNNSVRDNLKTKRILFLRSDRN